MSRGRTVLGTCIGLALCLGAVADDSDLPDSAFLEFLGTWDTGDDEWQEFFDSLPDAPPDLAAKEQETGRKTPDDSE